MSDSKNPSPNLREAYNSLRSNNVKIPESYKKDEGKPRLDLILGGFTRTLEGVARVATMGANKYDPPEGKEFIRLQNWKHTGMRWGRILGAMSRHLMAFMRGEDFDEESGELHIYHVVWGAMVLAESVYRYPHLDDREMRQTRTVRVGLDIDETILDMCTPIAEVIDKDSFSHYAWGYAAVETLQDLFAENFDWPAIEPGNELPFEPVAYITARHDNDLSRQQTQDWLDRHGFPDAELIMGANTGAMKVQYCLEQNIDLFVDDKFENYQALNNAGITCLLFDRPHNRKHNVGAKRIKSLKEVNNWL